LTIKWQIRLQESEKGNGKLQKRIWQQKREIREEGGGGDKRKGRLEGRDSLEIKRKVRKRKRMREERENEKAQEFFKKVGRLERVERLKDIELRIKDFKILWMCLHPVRLTWDLNTGACLIGPSHEINISKKVFSAFWKFYIVSCEEI
jgi:hypothetical protein